MKKQLLLLLLCFVGSLLPVFAQRSGTTGPLRWTLDNGTLTISGEGEMPDYQHLDISAPWAYDLITSIIIEEGVTSIGNDAFISAGFTDIVIPASLTRIGRGAFAGCSNLESIVIPETVITIEGAVFTGCKKLESVTLPNSITSIEVGTFSDCISLKTIEIPNSVTSIGLKVFSGCSNLKSIVIPDALTNIKGGAFAGSSLTGFIVSEGNTSYSTIDGVLYSEDQTILVAYPNAKSSSYTIPDLVKEIGDYAFADCSDLSSVIIPDGVTKIGNYAFSSCSKLTDIVLPESVTTIGDYAFVYCNNLENIEIPNSITEIGYQSFSRTKWYDKLPDGVLYIGKSLYEYKGEMPEYTQIQVREGTEAISSFAFSGRSALVGITIPGSVVTIGSGAFTNCKNLTNIVLPEGVRTIETGAFWGCGKLTDFSIPNSVTEIGNKAFSDCRNLAEFIISEDHPKYSVINGVLYNKDKTILIAYPNAKSSSYTIPDGVNVIGNNAFAMCTDLASVTIPVSVTVIDTFAFFYCTHLSEIYNYASVPQEIEENSFFSVDRFNCKVYVPKGSLAAYQSADVWKEFPNIIEKDYSPIFQIEENQVSVFSTPAGLVLETEVPIPVSVYMFSGQKVHSSKISGRQEIPLGKGFYWVYINNKAQKVVVY